LSKSFFIFFFLTASYNLLAQPDTSKSLPLHYNIDSLKKIYGNKKQMLKEYQLPTLIALSYYPELLNDKITFKYSEINSTARTTVTFGSVFKKINKKYIVLINTDSAKTGLVLSDAPLDAQIAVIGHELAHVTDFKTRSFFDMIWWGLRYLIVKQQTTIELKADKSTIRHGLGWPLYYWADFIINHSKANKQYKRMKETRYMQPNEILEFMYKHKLN
jgi:hypothetical protein